MEALFRLLYGPSAEERLRADAERVRDQVTMLDSTLRDKRRQAAEAQKRGNNAMIAGRKGEARSHFQQHIRLNNQCGRLERTKSTLMEADGQLEEAAAIDSITRANESAANAMETADRRMPAQKVRADATRLQLAKQRAEMKRELIDDALSMDEDDDADEDTNEREVQKMMDAAVLSHMPSTGALPSPLSASSAAAALPTLSPLGTSEPRK